MRAPGNVHAAPWITAPGLAPTNRNDRLAAFACYRANRPLCHLRMLQHQSFDLGRQHIDPGALDDIGIDRGKMKPVLTGTIEVVSRKGALRKIGQPA
jgi:hypothetical protein